MSHGNGSSAFVFQVTGILKPVTISTDKGLRLSHSFMVGCNSLYRSNFDFNFFVLKITSPTSDVISRYLEAKYDYEYYIFLCKRVIRFYTKKLSSIRSKLKAWRRFSWLYIFWRKKNECFYFVIYWGPKAPTALHRSEKEGGCRPPESSRESKDKKTIWIQLHQIITITWN